MHVEAKASVFGETAWWEYVARFIAGGVITAVTGWIAHRWGPLVGGLFLAFPALCPASLSLVEAHENRKQRRAGLPGIRMGRRAAGASSAGAALASVGLAAFALLIWREAPHLAIPLLLLLATVAWAAVAVALWALRQKV